ncbi:MAG: ABC transporter permease [Candidatus Methylarchaceae archaeon HK01B]|nr:ABC transporter permease [Candidatus Methylarchaceae archaeon HK01B]
MVDSLTCFFNGVIATAYKELKISLRYSTWILTMFAAPYILSILMQSIGSYAGGSEAYSNFLAYTGTENMFVYLILGALLWMMAAVIMWDVGLLLNNERWRGTLEQNAMAPVPFISLAVGFTIADILFTSPILIIGVASSLFIGGVFSLTSFFQISLLFIIGLLPLYGIGLLFGALSFRSRRSYSVVNILNTTLAILSGSLYPIAVLPVWLQFVSNLIPLTHATILVRTFSLLPQFFLSESWRLLFLVFMIVIYPLIGIYTFNMADRQARRKGDFAKY